MSFGDEFRLHHVLLEGTTLPCSRTPRERQAFFFFSFFSCMATNNARIGVFLVSLAILSPCSITILKFPFWAHAYAYVASIFNVIIFFGSNVVFFFIVAAAAGGRHASIEGN